MYKIQMKCEAKLGNLSQKLPVFKNWYEVVKYI